MRVLSIGEIFWRVRDGRESLAGEPFLLAAELARLGHTVFLLSAVGDDERGRRAREEAAARGVDVRFLGTSHQAETGVVANEADSVPPPGTRPLAYDFINPNEELMAGPFDAVCYGTHLQSFEPARRAASRVLQTFPAAIRLFDAHLPSDSPAGCGLEDPMSCASAVRLGEEDTGGSDSSLEDVCRTQLQLFNLRAIVAARADGSCLVLMGNQTAEAAAAGLPDATFNARFLHAIGAGWTASQTAEFLESGNV